MQKKKMSRILYGYQNKYWEFMWHLRPNLKRNIHTGPFYI